MKISRRDYAAMFGPTVGDGVRLGDTSLIAEVEKDYAVYGDECLHGGGKTLRDGMGLAAGVTSAEGALDLLLCNAVVIDASTPMFRTMLWLAAVAPLANASPRSMAPVTTAPRGSLHILITSVAASSVDRSRVPHA